jgi:zinc transporter ZupT
VFRAVIDESVNYLSNSNAEGSFLKALTFAFAMSFHSILEGFALGVQVMLQNTLMN